MSTQSILKGPDWILRSKKVCVSDPMWLRSGNKFLAKTGLWHSNVSLAKIDKWGTREIEMLTWHNSIRKPKRVTEQIGTVGVDAGVAAVFDGEFEYSYGYLADIKHIGSMPENTGVVCHSGFGDGAYAIYGIYQGKELVAIKIIFIDAKEINLMNMIDQKF